MAAQKASLGRAESVAERVAREMGYELVDVELVKEPAGRYLRFYVDREGGITLDEVEAFHRAIQPQVEDVDYDYMEVSSPGADRPLKKPSDFQRAVGQAVEIRTYKPIDGTKYHTGELIGLDQGGIAIRAADGRTLTFEQKAVALCRLLVEFDEADLMDDVPEPEE